VIEKAELEEKRGKGIRAATKEGKGGRQRIQEDNVMPKQNEGEAKCGRRHRA